MTSPSGFDARMRELHRASLEQLPPQTLTRIRSARGTAHAKAPRRAWPWLAATACSGLLAAYVGMQWMPSHPTADSVSATIASQGSQTGKGDASALLDENPELYLWLASADAQPLAME